MNSSFIKPYSLSAVFAAAGILACGIGSALAHADGEAASVRTIRTTSPNPGRTRTASTQRSLELGADASTRSLGPFHNSGTLAQAVVPVEPSSGDSGSVTVATADSFVNSIGFNAHFENYHTPYITQFPKVKALLVAAGVRHVRVGMMFHNDNLFTSMRDLAASGVYASYTTSLNLTQNEIDEFPSLVGPSFEQYEAPNEQDDHNKPDWAARARSFQEHLYTWVKSDPQLARYPVLGPSLTGGEKEHSELGDLSAYMDYANIHDYFSEYNPGTPGWGRKTQYGIYGSYRRSLNLVKLTSANKPVMSTETGFGGIPTGSQTQFDFRTQMRYLTRVFFEHFNSAVVRTYSYEFIDRGGTGAYSYFGVLQYDLTPKPAYTAIKSIIGALNDPGAPFTPTPLSFELTGSTSDVHRTLLQKRNGQYILALWLEVRSWKAHTGGDIIIPDQDITLSTAASFSGAKLSTMDESGRFSTRALHWSNNAATFPVSDKISLVTLTR